MMGNGVPGAPIPEEQTAAVCLPMSLTEDPQHLDEVGGKSIDHTGLTPQLVNSPLPWTALLSSSLCQFYIYGGWSWRGRPSGVSYLT